MDIEYGVIKFAFNILHPSQIEVYSIFMKINDQLPFKQNR